MKNWYDLTKNERNQLKEEFNKKSNNKIFNTILFIFMFLSYMLSFLTFLLILILVIAKASNGCYGNACNENLIILSGIFIIFILTAIICSLLISKNNKKFIKWLKYRNIEK